MTLSTQKIRDYSILGTLGQNREGGRITHLAQAPNGVKVVIKKFRFATDSTWGDYSAIAREVAILKTLDHPHIPKCLDSFETEYGACLVQEYIEAPNLDQKRTYTTEQVRQIAQDLLEILIYLQSLTPPVLHRDIKPGNLLLDADGNLYLVNFGFSRIGLEDVAVSSMVRGTTGFMPPEQMLGLDLTKASDLYSVGATLICLILGIPSGRMAQLMDIGENRLKFSDRLSSDIDPHFVRWLYRMTEPRASDRLADAKSARAALDCLEETEEEKAERLPSRPEAIVIAHTVANQKLNLAKPWLRYGGSATAMLLAKGVATGILQHYSSNTLNGLTYILLLGFTNVLDLLLLLVGMVAPFAIAIFLLPLPSRATRGSVKALANAQATIPANEDF
jgi:serine/threonine protein kinase